MLVIFNWFMLSASIQSEWRTAKHINSGKIESFEFGPDGTFSRDEVCSGRLSQIINLLKVYIGFII